MTEDVPIWIEQNRPRGGILEQVWKKFATTPLDDSTDETECQCLLGRLETLGYYTRALRLDHGTWASGGKIRLGFVYVRLDSCMCVLASRFLHVSTFCVCELLHLFHG